MNSIPELADAAPRLDTPSISIRSMNLSTKLCLKIILSQQITFILVDTYFGNNITTISARHKLSLSYIQLRCTNE